MTDYLPASIARGIAARVQHVMSEQPHLAEGVVMMAAIQAYRGAPLELDADESTSIGWNCGYQLRERDRDGFDYFGTAAMMARVHEAQYRGREL